MKNTLGIVVIVPLVCACACTTGPLSAAPKPAASPAVVQGEGRLRYEGGIPIVESAEGQPEGHFEFDTMNDQARLKYLYTYPYDAADKDNCERHVHFDVSFDVDAGSRYRIDVIPAPLSPVKRTVAAEQLAGDSPEAVPIGVYSFAHVVRTRCTE